MAPVSACIRLVANLAVGGTGPLVAMDLEIHGKGTFANKVVEYIESLCYETYVFGGIVGHPRGNATATRPVYSDTP